MYSGETVRYGSSQSIHVPMDWKSSSIFARFSSAKDLHSSMKASIPYSSMSFLELKPSSSSTFTSMGRPCMS